MKEELELQTPEWAETLLVPSRYKGAFGGRASGKSHFFAELLLERCLVKKTFAVGIREVQKSLNQSVKKLLEDKIDLMGLNSSFKIMHDHILTPYGGRIIFVGMNNITASSITSLEGYDVAWVEEAQTLSQTSLDLLRPTIRKDTSGEVSELWFSWNPRLATDPVDMLLREIAPKDSIVVRANYMDNPWLPKSMKDEIEYDRGRDPDKYAHVWLGEYLQRSEARVFKNWVVEEFERPEGTVYRLGADWGFASDPTTLVRMSIEGNRLYVDYEAYMIGCEIVNLPDLFARVPESTKWWITADSARPETIDYMQSNGYPKINKAVKGAKSIDEGIEFLKSFDIVVHPRCKHVIDELTLYSYKIDKLTDQVLPVLSDKQNHLIDALRYACEGVRRVKTAKVFDFKMAKGNWMAA